MKSKTLKIFIKNTQLGKVKTRLAASIGDDEALKVYKKLLNYTRIMTSKVDSQKEVWYSNFIQEKDDWNTLFCAKKIQKGEDLGIRMKNAFGDSFEMNKDEKVILIGSDCAELTSEIIEKAFEELEKHDVVIGPAKDGGYYLIGMNSYYPKLFTNIEWSTSSVFKKTMSTIQENELSYFLLKELNDVDTIEDWNSVKGLIDN